MRSALEVIERLVVILAAVLALFPLWQWWSESEARELDRISNLATAGALCRDRALDLGGYGTPAEVINDYGTFLIEMFRLAADNGEGSDSEAVRQQRDELLKRREAFAQEYAGFEDAMDKICDEALTATASADTD
ncbi:hypothetical protein JMM63_15065 [Rhodovulum sulfidophilum]|uniref:hypothetical protein n=1 Tax=Rhodovulum sulfidophilum TaxID=35806 RepID=UPI001923380F|nr:hypothetical protein [Rhodovulum sulfidophilum]MBL3596868.1 hypothetical protein [Rhodovulum sulfidophilum]